MAAGGGGRGCDRGAAALSVAKVEAGRAGGLGGAALTARAWRQRWRKKPAGRVGGWQAVRRSATGRYRKITRNRQENCQRKRSICIRKKSKSHEKNMKMARKNWNIAEKQQKPTRKITKTKNGTQNNKKNRKLPDSRQQKHKTTRKLQDHLQNIRTDWRMTWKKNKKLFLDKLTN
jgi:hypothetical protein